MVIRVSLIYISILIQVHVYNLPSRVDVFRSLRMSDYR